MSAKPGEADGEKRGVRRFVHSAGLVTKCPISSAHGSIAYAFVCECCNQTIKLGQPAYVSAVSKLAADRNRAPGQTSTRPNKYVPTAPASILRARLYPIVGQKRQDVCDKKFQESGETALAPARGGQRVGTALGAEAFPSESDRARSSARGG